MCAPGSTPSGCASPSTTVGGVAIGWGSSGGVSRHRGPIGRTRTCGLPSRSWTRTHELRYLLNVVDGYTQREIGAMLDVPEGTVASWIARGKVRLRSALEAAP